MIQLSRTDHAINIMCSKGGTATKVGHDRGLPRSFFQCVHIALWDFQDTRIFSIICGRTFSSAKDGIDVAEKLLQTVYVLGVGCFVNLMLPWKARRLWGRGSSSMLLWTLRRDLACSLSKRIQLCFMHRRQRWLFRGARTESGHAGESSCHEAQTTFLGTLLGPAWQSQKAASASVG
eukprot:1319615-Amphidinium_carterae.1